MEKSNAPPFGRLKAVLCVIAGCIIAAIAILAYEGFQSLVNKHQPRTLVDGGGPVVLAKQDQPFTPHPNPALLVASGNEKTPEPKESPPLFFVTSDSTTTKDPPVKVEILSALIGRIPVGGNALLGTTWSEPILCITVQVTNLKEHPVYYKTWSGVIATPDGRNLARAWDDEGTHLTRRYASSSSLGPHPEGRVIQECINKDEKVTDVLVFEMPKEGFKHIDLELPGHNLSTSGYRPTFHVRIPANAIDRK